MISDTLYVTLGVFFVLSFLDLDDHQSGSSDPKFHSNRYWCGPLLPIVLTDLFCTLKHMPFSLGMLLNLLLIILIHIPPPFQDPYYLDVVLLFCDLIFHLLSWNSIKFYFTCRGHDFRFLQRIWTVTISGQLFPLSLCNDCLLSKCAIYSYTSFF